MPFRRGDIALVLFPNSDLRTTKKRPALVVQANNLNTGLPQLIVAMITSNLSRAGHPSRVFVPLASPEGRQAGLISDSVILTDNLTTVLEAEISHSLGFWADMAPVEKALRHTCLAGDCHAADRDEDLRDAAAIKILGGLRECRCPGPVIVAVVDREVGGSLTLEALQPVLLDRKSIVSINRQEGADGITGQNIPL